VSPQKEPPTRNENPYWYRVGVRRLGKSERRTAGLNYGGGFVVTHSFARYLCLSIDAQGYGRAHDRGQAALQDELVDVLATSAAAAGLDRTAWHRQAAGDGELALIPASEPDTETKVVDEFVRELAAVLFRRNYDKPAGDRFRLRLAMDHGLAQMASNGFAGQLIVAVSRLVDSRPLRQALAAAPEANLAVILSRRVYTDFVLGGHTRLRPTDFRQVWVSQKEYADQAWLRVPGADVHRLPLTLPATRDPLPDGVPARRDQPTDAHRGQVVANEFNAPVDVTGGVIGIRNDW
jgi:hypothetical protein